MSVIAPPGPNNPNSSSPDPDPNQGQSSAGIPGAVAGSKWVETAEDAKAADKSHEVNPRPRSSEEADADARKVQQENQVAPAPEPRRVVIEPASSVPATPPQRGNRNG